MPIQAAYRPMLARQPILDRSLRLEAYELLYRAPVGMGRPSGLTMTARVLLDWFTAIADPAADVPVWVNFPATLLVDPELIHTFPPHHLVVEVLESVTVTERLVEAVERLKEGGFKVVLDDWVPGDGRGALLPIVDGVKLDVLGLDQRTITAEVGYLKGLGAQVIAEKVETWEQQQWCLDAGCDSFQGYFLATPVIQEGATLPGPVVSVIRILAEMNKEEWAVERIVSLIRSEPALATRMLRLANATYLAARTPADSIQEAVMRLGASTIRRWLVVCSMADANRGPTELTRLAITRARLTELLMEASNPDRSESAFTAGMLSAVPAMFGTSIESLLRQVAVSDELATAIAAHEGEIGSKLEAALQIEHFGGTPIAEADTDLPALYVQAASWADQVIGHL